MIVWLVTVGEPLPLVDEGNPRLMRTGTLARRLTDSGHEVSWWTSAFDHYRKSFRSPIDTDFDWDGCSIKMIRSVGYRKNISLRRFFEHAGVARKFRRKVNALKPPDIVLASLPTIELAREAVAFAVEHDVPVLVDVRDLWPDLLVDAFPRFLRPAAGIILQPMFRDTRMLLARCTGIIGISQGYLEWGLRNAGRRMKPQDAVFPLGYAPPGMTRPPAVSISARLKTLGVNDSGTVCWYVGSFGRQYDLSPVIMTALSLQSEGNSDIQFVISGDGERGDLWREMARECRNVLFTGWIGADDINALRARATIGLQPYIEGAPQGLANKLFEYLSAGIPVLSALRGENEDLILRHQCGLTYAAGDPGDFSSKLRLLVNDHDLCARMGLNGKALFDSQYSGEIIFDGLVEHMKKAVERANRGVARG